MKFNFNIDLKSTLSVREQLKEQGFRIKSCDDICLYEDLKKQIGSWLEEDKKIDKSIISERLLILKFFISRLDKDITPIEQNEDNVL